MKTQTDLEVERYPGPRWMLIQRLPLTRALPWTARRPCSAHLGVRDQHFTEHVSDGAVLRLTADVKAAVFHDLGRIGPVLVAFGLQGNQRGGVRLGCAVVLVAVTGQTGWMFGQSPLTRTRYSELLGEERRRRGHFCAASVF